MSNGFCGNTNVQNTTDRDCKHCLHKVPYLKDDGTWGAECEAWNCEFVSRDDAKKALEESALQYTKGYQDGFLEAKKLYRDQHTGEDHK